jgi:eukaryotic-like serine/threonine-protein kinase
MAQNKLAEAEPRFREALTIFRASGADRPEMAMCLDNLSKLASGRGDLTRAEPLMRESVEMRRRLYQGAHPDLATGLDNLASLLLEQNKLDEAEPHLREALEIFRATLPAGHPFIAVPLTALANLLDVRGDPAGLAEAEPLIREGLTIREKFQPDVWTTFNSRSVLGGVLLGQKKLDEAEPVLLDGYREMQEREATIDPTSRRLHIAEALERLVRLYEAKGDATEAAAWRSKLEAARAAQNEPAEHGGK